MQLYITEKPSVAKALVDFFNTHNGHFKKIDNYYIDESIHATVTWAVGHLLYSNEPNAYDPKYASWKIEDLPIVPPNFNFQKSVYKDKKAQYKAIQSLIKDATTIIHMGDPDREGQYLIDELLTDVKGKDVQRVLLNALDDTSIGNALKAITDNSQFFGLSEAGKGRDYLDWLLGINLTRFFTIKARQGGYTSTMRVGRVKAPTLNLIVTRYLDAMSFQKSKYFTVNPSFEIDGMKIPLKLDPHEHFVIEITAETTAESLKNKKATITEINHTTITEPIKVQYSLDSLQVEANKQLGFSPKTTLALLQELYEKKYVTYPRSDCKFLPVSQFSNAQGIISNLINKNALTGQINDFVFDNENKPIPYNDNKVTAHHAIVPTLEVLEKDSLSQKHWDLYQLIVKQYASMFLPAYSYQKIDIKLTCGEYKLQASTKQVLEKGYTVLLPSDTANTFTLPFDKLQEGDQVLLNEVIIKTGETKPPKLFTEGTLIKAMSTISSDNAELASKLKEIKGIGTPATRASIIDDLIKEKLIVIDKKSILPTKAGINLIKVLPDEIKSADFTAVMEQDLDHIQDHTKTVESVLEETVSYLMTVFENNKNTSILNTDNPCPLCKAGYLHYKTYKDKTTGEKKEYYRCTNEDCKQVFPVTKKGQPKLIRCPECGGYYQSRMNKETGDIWYSCSNYANGCKSFMLPEDFDTLG